jgi:putative DNA primase/helicase
MANNLSFAERLQLAKQQSAPAKRTKKTAPAPVLSIGTTQFFTMDLFGGYDFASDRALQDQGCELFIANGDEYIRWNGPRPAPKSTFIMADLPEHTDNFTDLGNAQRMVRMFGDRIRYCTEFKKWLLWDDHRWLICGPAEIYTLAIETIRSLIIDAAFIEDFPTREKIIKHSLASESSAKLKAMIEIAEKLPGVLIHQNRLDTDHFKLNVLNGTLDLKTGSLNEPDRADYNTKQASVEFNTFAGCRTWEKFLDRVMGGNKELIRYIQKAVGYSLSGSTAQQCMYVLHGSGSNGKSTFVKTIETLLHDYSSHCPAATLMVKQEGISNDIARLRGSRFVAAVETDEGKRLAESLIKELTGSDVITSRFLYGEFFEFIPCFKIWLACNHKPVIRGTDMAIWRRVKLIPFTVTIPQAEWDLQLGEKLAKEMPGILNWALEGCQAWADEGIIDPPEVQAATSGYRKEMDLLGSWIDECCICLASVDARAGLLYENYKTWCDDNGEYVVSARMFGMKLSERGYDKIPKSAGAFYIGIALKA